jgi:hypothetical protein
MGMDSGDTTSVLTDDILRRLVDSDPQRLPSKKPALPKGLPKARIKPAQSQPVKKPNAAGSDQGQVQKKREADVNRGITSARLF